MIAVITTIASPTNSVKLLTSKIDDNASIIIIGDTKGPKKYPLEKTIFYSIENQLKSPFEIAKILPTKHYARKNIGYLLAIQSGEDLIYETDDDNAPNNHWYVRSKEIDVVLADKKSDWINIYKHFTSENIWPRGFLLDHIAKESSTPRHNGEEVTVKAPIQQGLADVSPDVDAIWRLTQDREFYFERKPSIALPSGSWCPFNTQTTWWWKEAFPLLYLPSYCTFRMTDIWKSFVAQRCLWEMGYPLVFHAAEVDQDRNLHNLMRDFESEVSGYLQNQKLTETLEQCKLKSGADNALDNLVICYEALIKAGLLPEKEMDLVKAWAKDIEPLL
ncbi:STELLO glycosyltransferase family protein [Phaeodactylibacter xiamenensis]|uniref:STELLO glycosyltransferase family protein n=1 Tax=Phaeodactylibacter xiamenensis TaxID=1524460 RepID=UPI0024A820B1|nr:STELLO glycosyltransferase family protein [Phaeodactylibacter xiamenensis]